MPMLKAFHSTLTLFYHSWTSAALFLLVVSSRYEAFRRSASFSTLHAWLKMSYYTSSESSDSDAPYCPCCDSSFVHSKALEQHCSAKDHVSCPRCNAILLTWGDLQVHLETSHFYCSNCDRFFDTENSVDQVSPVMSPERSAVFKRTTQS